MEVTVTLTEPVCSCGPEGYEGYDGCRQGGCDDNCRVCSPGPYDDCDFPESHPVGAGIWFQKEDERGRTESFDDYVVVGVSTPSANGKSWSGKFGVWDVWAPNPFVFASNDGGKTAYDVFESDIVGWP